MRDCFDIESSAAVYKSLEDACVANRKPSGGDVYLQGHCRRYTPVAGRFRGEDERFEHDHGQWPLVMDDDWCGEFEVHAELQPHDIATSSRHVGAGSNILPPFE